MKVSEIVQKLGLTVYAGHEGLENMVTGGYASDLLSDVMGNAREGDAWITIQAHKNVIAVATLKDLPVVILVNGIKPDEATMEQGSQEKIAIVGSPAGAFEIAGKLYKLLIG